MGIVCGWRAPMGTGNLLRAGAWLRHFNGMGRSLGGAAQRVTRHRQRLLIETLESGLLLAGDATFDWWMRDTLQSHSTGRMTVPNTSQYANPGYFPVVLDISSFIFDDGTRPNSVTFQIRDSATGAS